MGKKSCQESLSSNEKIPHAYMGIQVNTCKNPNCDKFGVISKRNQQDIATKDRSQHGKRDSHYAISGLGKGVPGLKCKGCGEITPIKSNLGVHEEYERLKSYLCDKDYSCPNAECENHSVTITSSPKSYSKFGKTNGAQRFQCKSCRKTFSTSTKRRRQNRSEINKTLFKLLVNKVPIRRCCEILDISPSTFYHKVDWLYEQALGFIQERERKLIEQCNAERLYLSTDRQVQVTNWVSREDKRNTEILALGTADNDSSYVFGWHFNFDPSLNPQAVEKETILLNDYQKQTPFRKHARLWLELDYQDAMSRSARKQRPQGSLEGEIEEKYLVESSRDHIESSEVIDSTVKPPANGVLVHSEYTMHSHFLLLNDLLRNVEKVRFSLDQETGIKNAFMAAFRQRVLAGTADAFYVKANKDLTVDQKKILIRESHRRVKEKFGVNYTSLSSREKQRAVQSLIIEEMAFMKRFNHSKELWLKYPFATNSEPEKFVAALTNVSRYTVEHQANLYKRASLHGIDRFFMQARRRVNILERPFASGTNSRRVWYGYSSYNPSMLIKSAELFRLFYNYIHSETVDKKTPAMRLGLAKGKVSFEKIIYFDR